jgi:hypothetical protein
LPRSPFDFILFREFSVSAQRQLREIDEEGRMSAEPPKRYLMLHRGRRHFRAKSSY